MERRVTYEFTRSEIALINEALGLLMKERQGIVDDETFWNANELSLALGEEFYP